jgi:hypothetical protein
MGVLCGNENVWVSTDEITDTGGWKTADASEVFQNGGKKSIMLGNAYAVSNTTITCDVNDAVQTV